MGITTNIDKVVKDIKKQQDKIKKGAVRALNKAGRDSHPEVKRQVRKKYNVKASAINKAKKIKRASKQRPAYLLIYKSTRINVREFGVRQNRKGITWKVKKVQKFRLDHGFKVGHNSSRPARILDRFGMIRTGRFKAIQGRNEKRIRKGLNKGRKRTAASYREIIKSVTGPSIPQLLKNKNLQRIVQLFFANKYKKHLRDGIRIKGFKF